MAHIVARPAGRALALTSRRLGHFVQEQSCKRRGRRSGLSALASTLDRWHGNNPNRYYYSTKRPSNRDRGHIFEGHEDPGPPPPLPDNVVTGPSEKVQQLVEEIMQLNVLELAQLIQVYKDALGIDEIPMGDFEDGEGGDSEGAPAGDASKEEKTVFDVKITGFGEKTKIKVIKEVRAISGLGLKEAKEVVESLPKVIKNDVKKEEADELVKKLEAAGATVEIV